MSPRLSLAIAGVSLCLGLIATIGLIRAEAGLVHGQTVVNGVPVYMVRSVSVSGPQPAAVVAHGFGSSARMMRDLTETLARQGFVVVSLDFSGHGRSTVPLRKNPELVLEIGTAVDYLHGLPGVDPQRVVLVGHSMGATAVTTYASQHDDIAATVALSLPDVPSNPPAPLLMLVGSLEPPAFHHPGTVKVTGADHILILFAPEAHRDLTTWLWSTLETQPLLPGRGFSVGRFLFGMVLLLAFALGIFPLATIRTRWRAVILAGYAVAAVAIPVHFGLTHAVPSGIRWILLLVLASGAYTFGYGLALLASGKFWRHAGISLLLLALLVVAAAVGAAPGIVLLAAPAAVALLLWYSAWSTYLERMGVPRPQAVLPGAILLAWPVATAVPLLPLPLPF